MGTKHIEYKINDVVKGLRLISEPYKINGKKDYRVMVQCTLCNKDPYEIILTEIKRHTYDGCPDCAKRQRSKTHEKFINEIESVSPNIIILSKYACSKQKINCMCRVCGYKFSAFPSNLLKGHGCKKCASQLSSAQKRITHDDFVERIRNINPNIEVVGVYVRSSKPIKCRCTIDEHKWDAWPDHLLRGHGCPVCAGKGVFVGYNDIPTTRPDLIKYFKTETDAQMFTEHSNKYADLICPYCGYQKHMIVGHLSKTGFACPICGDGISYPNKFCRQVLKQLPIQNFQCEYHSDWTESYLYDNYFEYNGTKYIVEADGVQHFKHTSNCWPSFESIKQIDDIKTQLAISHGCIVIRIDCQKSEMRYIKNSILNSCLSNIFDLSHIDWLSCEDAARASLVYEVCKFYNTSDNKQIKYIAKQLDLSEPTIRKYLKIGFNIGICDYQVKTYKLSVTAYCIDSGEVFSFPSVSMCSKELSNLYNIKIESKGIYRACRGEQKTYKGFIFQFKDGDIYA